MVGHVAAEPVGDDEAAERERDASERRAPAQGDAERRSASTQPSPTSWPRALERRSQQQLEQISTPTATREQRVDRRSGGIARSAREERRPCATHGDARAARGFVLRADDRGSSPRMTPGHPAPRARSSARPTTRDAAAGSVPGHEDMDGHHATSTPTPRPCSTCSPTRTRAGRWAPVPFDLDDPDAGPARRPARRCGSPASWPAAASASTSRSTRPTTGRLALPRDGPVAFDVAYEARAAGAGQRGPRLGLRPLRRRAHRPPGREATAALLTAGALGVAVDRIARLGRPPEPPHAKEPPMTALPLEPPRLRPPTAVAARALTRRYGDGESAVDALRGVSLEVPAGQFTAVMGPSGSGKSTLMHLLAGLDRPTSGSRPRSAARTSPTMADQRLTKLRRRHIGFVFQSFNLLPTLTAEENVMLPLAIARQQAGRGRGRRADRARRPDRPPRPQAGRALRRPAAARRDRPRADRPADGAVRRRADRQPRLGLRRRGARAAARGRRRSTARRP